MSRGGLADPGNTRPEHGQAVRVIRLTVDGENYTVLTAETERPLKNPTQHRSTQH